MSTEVFTEPWISPGQVATALGVSPASVIRWIRTGARGPDGSRVFLEGRRLGGLYRTTQTAVDTFVQSLNPHLKSNPLPTVADLADRKRRARAALEQIRRAGRKTPPKKTKPRHD